MSRSVRNWINSKMSKPARGEIPLPKDVNYTNLRNEFRELGDVEEYELMPGNEELNAASNEWKEKREKRDKALEKRLNPDFRALRALQNRNNKNTNRTGTGTRNGSGLFGHSISRGGRLFKSKKNRKSKGKKNKNKKNTRRIKK